MTPFSSQECIPHASCGIIRTSTPGEKTSQHALSTRSQPLLLWHWYHNSVFTLKSATKESNCIKGRSDTQQQVNCITNQPSTDNANTILLFCVKHDKIREDYFIISVEKWQCAHPSWLRYWATEICFIVIITDTAIAYQQDYWDRYLIWLNGQSTMEIISGWNETFSIEVKIWNKKLFLKNAILSKTDFQ